MQTLSLSFKQFEEQLALFSTEWETTLQGKVSMLEQTIQELQDKFQNLSELHRQQNSKLEVHERRFAHIKPLLATAST
jgi:prefoldin subunit 5